MLWVSQAEEQAVTEAKSCSGRRLHACDCTSVCMCRHTCAVLCLPGCWRVCVFDSELVSGFMSGCETLKMIRWVVFVVKPPCMIAWFFLPALLLIRVQRVATSYLMTWLLAIGRQVKILSSYIFLSTCSFKCLPHFPIHLLFLLFPWCWLFYRNVMFSVCFFL